MSDTPEDFGDEDVTLEAPEPSEELLEAAHEADHDVTEDSIPDGTQPVGEIDATLVEEGDAGVGDAEIEYDEDPFAEGDN